MLVTPTERQQAANAYLAALRTAGEALRVTQDAPSSWLRPLRRLQQEHAQRAAWRMLVRARIDAKHAEDQVVSLAVGAGTVWGLLSSTHSDNPRTVEDVLFAMFDERARKLRDRLPAIRALVELGQGTDALAGAHASVVALAKEYPILHDFLPVHARPAVKAVEELERTTDLITFLVTERDEDWGAPFRHIKLHDIVSHVRGAGLGTAALRELCSYADRRGLPILADFVPGFDADEAHTLRLGNWYHRHGFRQGDRQPKLWAASAPIRRDPTSRWSDHGTIFGGAGQC